jgi:hypothetical protein
MRNRGDVPSSLGWLPAVIPADARSFRVAHVDLANSLLDAGATIVDDAADVEIADPYVGSDGAGFVIVTIHAAQAEGGKLPRRAVRRLHGSLRARARATSVRRRLRADGWAGTSTVLWDIEQPIQLPGARGSLRDLRPAEVLPQRALVSGWHGQRPRTVLEAVAEEAAAAVGQPVVPRRALARAGLTVVLSDGFVVRVAVGPGRRKLELLEAGLHALHAGEPPPIVERTVPWILAQGRCGLADWAVERRLSGASAPRRLSTGLLNDCVDFLVALHRCGRDSRRSSIIEDAQVVSGACPSPQQAALVLALGRTLDQRLGDMPRGFGHGDFWTPNLLVRNDRLSGVVDWDSAAADRLPAIDLMHLVLTARRQLKREYIGQGVVGHHLAWARAGGDGVVHSYARKLGLDLGPARLEALVMAYWLDRISFELRLYSDRTRRPVWMRNNIGVVLEELPCFLR